MRVARLRTIRLRSVPTFIDNFEEQLIGKTTGEECEVNVTFPAEYHVEELKNKPAVFKVKVKEIQRKRASGS